MNNTDTPSRKMKSFGSNASKTSTAMTVSFSKAEMEKLDFLARLLGTTKARLVRQAVEDACDKLECNLDGNLLPQDLVMKELDESIRLAAWTGCDPAEIVPSGLEFKSVQGMKAQCAIKAGHLTIEGTLDIFCGPPGVNEATITICPPFLARVTPERELTLVLQSPPTIGAARVSARDERDIGMGRDEVLP